MTDFTLDDRLRLDTHHLLTVDDIEILLSDNALWPWFILVPHTTETELYRLSDKMDVDLHRLTLALSRFIGEQFPVDKINVAAIGNVVSQLHVHVVGRRRDDPAWPGVVWGFAQKEPRVASSVNEIRTALCGYLL